MTAEVAATRTRFRPKDAATYLGISIYTLRNLRLADRDALSSGGRASGPKFIRVGPNIVVYRREDLDAWLERRAQATQRALRRQRKR